MTPRELQHVDRLFPIRVEDTEAGHPSQWRRASPVYPTNRSQ